MLGFILVKSKRHPYRVKDPYLKTILGYLHTSNQELLEHERVINGLLRSGKNLKEAVKELKQYDKTSKQNLVGVIETLEEEKEDIESLIPRLSIMIDVFENTHYDRRDYITPIRYAHKKGSLEHEIYDELKDECEPERTQNFHGYVLFNGAKKRIETHPNTIRLNINKVDFDYKTEKAREVEEPLEKIVAQPPKQTPEHKPRESGKEEVVQRSDDKGTKPKTLVEVVYAVALEQDVKYITPCEIAADPRVEAVSNATDLRATVNSCMYRHPDLFKKAGRGLYETIPREVAGKGEVQTSQAYPVDPKTFLGKIYMVALKIGGQVRPKEVASDPKVKKASDADNIGVLVSHEMSKNKKLFRKVKWGVYEAIPSGTSGKAEVQTSQAYPVDTKTLLGKIYITALKIGGVVSPKEVAADPKVKKASDADNIGAVVSMYMSSNKKLFKKIGRGQYEAIPPATSPRGEAQGQSGGAGNGQFSMNEYYYIGDLGASKLFKGRAAIEKAIKKDEGDKGDVFKTERRKARRGKPKLYILLTQAVWDRISKSNKSKAGRPRRSQVSVGTAEEDNPPDIDKLAGEAGGDSGSEDEEFIAM